MKRFSYRAFDGEDRTEEGIIEAETRREAAGKLFSLGLHPISVEEEAAKKKKGKHPFRKHRVLSTFCREWAALLEAGISMTDSLSLLETEEGKRGKEILSAVEKEIASGRRVSESFASTGEFTPFYLAMVEVGELSGTLPDQLRTMAAYYRQEADFLESLQKAAAYPLFVLSFSFLVLLLILTAVLPSFASLFHYLGVPLPGLVRGALWAGEGIRQYGLFFLAGFLFLLLCFLRYKRTARGQAQWEAWLFRRASYRRILLVRFCLTLSSLLKSGKPLSESLEDTARVIGNRKAGGEIQKIGRAVRGGGRFDEALGNSSFSTDAVRRLIHVGMESGELPAFLHHAAELLSEETKRKLNRFRSLLEPALLLLVGSMAAFLLFSVFMPVLSMMGKQF